MAKFRKICIVGPGLIGGSLALALKKTGVAETIVGIGHRSSSLEKAIKIGAIDKGFLNFEKGIKGSDLIVLATPVATILKYLKEGFSSLEEGAVVTDTGSTKKEIVKRAELFSRSFYFVGGHPIAGSEKRGIDAARADLFKKKVVILTRTKKTDQRALQMVKELWKRVGARPEVLSPEQHDKIIGLLSHLPHLVAVTLVKTAKESLKRGNLSFAGSGFKDTTRIATGSPHLWRDIFSTNREEILNLLVDFRQSLTVLEKLIKRRNWEELKNQLKEVKHFRAQI